MKKKNKRKNVVSSEKLVLKYVASVEDVKEAMIKTRALKKRVKPIKKDIKPPQIDALAILNLYEMCNLVYTKNVVAQIVKVNYRGIKVDGNSYWNEKLITGYMGMKVRVIISDTLINVYNLNGELITTFIKYVFLFQCHFHYLQILLQEHQQPCGQPFY